MNLSEIKKISIQNKVPIVRDKTIKYIANFIILNKINHLLEIGSAMGYSSSYLSLEIPNLKIETIEKDNNRYLFCKENIKNSNIKFINECAYEFIPNKKYDCIFLDGPKSKQIILFNKYSNFIYLGGFIIIDNIFLKDLNPKIKSKRKLLEKSLLFIDYLQNLINWDVKIINIDDGIAICKKIG